MRILFVELLFVFFWCFNLPLGEKIIMKKRLLFVLGLSLTANMARAACSTGIASVTVVSSLSVHKAKGLDFGCISSSSNAECISTRDVRRRAASPSAPIITRPLCWTDGESSVNFSDWIRPVRSDRSALRPSVQFLQDAKLRGTRGRCGDFLPRQ